MFRNPYSFSFRHALQIHSDIPRKTPDSACTRLAEKVRIKKRGAKPLKVAERARFELAKGLRLRRFSRPCCPFSALLRCQDRCNQPLCHLSNNFSTYPSELRSDDGLRLNRGANAPCSPISASLRCQDCCNQPPSFKTTGAVLVCTQNSPKGQEFFKNYLRLPIRRR